MYKKRINTGFPLVIFFSMAVIALVIFARPASLLAAGKTNTGSTEDTNTAQSSRTAADASQPATAAPSAAAKTPEAPAASGAASSTASTEPLKQIFEEKGIDPAKADISILVYKASHELSLLANGAVVKTYHVELGDNGLGDKQIAGDHKTPEGTFYISQKLVLDPPDQYLGTRWMRLSYPNMEDAERGLKQGLISQSTYDTIANAIEKGGIPPQDTALGGVGIHGGSVPSFGSDWTYGCVGLTNSNVEDFYNYVKVGTKVVIKP